MRAKEFIREDSSATVAGNMATVSMPIGGMISRQAFNKPTKYMNALTRPLERKKKNVN